MSPPKTPVTGVLQRKIVLARRVPQSVAVRALRAALLTGGAITRVAPRHGLGAPLAPLTLSWLLSPTLTTPTVPWQCREAAKQSVVEDLQKLWAVK